MRMSSKSECWAVYQKVLRGQQASVRVICEQSEWDAMEKENPGVFPLVRGWIRNEVEAERLAREKPLANEPGVAEQAPPSK